jgi:hypothetical protein
MDTFFEGEQLQQTIAAAQVEPMLSWWSRRRTKKTKTKAEVMKLGDW